jgi:cysteine-rich repeat protein
MRISSAILVLLWTACSPAPTPNPDNNTPPDNPPNPPIPSAVCGNGVVETGETCDDGNTDAGDGCDANCATEPEPPVNADDHGNTPETASTLRVDAPARGIFEVADDIDVFGFTIAVEGLYTLTVTGSGTLSCQITDGQGAVVGEHGMEEGCQISKELSPGLYHVALSMTAGDVPANYSLVLRENEGGNTGGSCGDGERDFGEGCDDGNTVAGDGCDQNCQPELGEDAHGDSRDQASALALDTDQDGAINVGGDVDYFSFTTDQAGEYQIETSSETDLYCHLENEAGEELATDDDSGEGLNCQLIEELAGQTQYFLKVRGYSETRTGNYSVSVRYLVPPVCGNGEVERGEACDDGNAEDGDGCDSNCTIEDDFGNDIDHAHRVEDPSTLEANLIEEDADVFTFTAAATGPRQIHPSGELDTFCHLYDSQGNELATDDDSGERLNCKVVHDLEAGATYFVKVRGFSDYVTGNYNFHLGAVAADPDPEP